MPKTSSKLKKITHNKLAKELLKGEVRFSFQKLDGTNRIALGTTNLKLIPDIEHPKGGHKPTGTIFYDLEVEAWRCIALDSEIWLGW